MKIKLLSIVIPLHNEAKILRELVRRCLSSGEAACCPFELVLVDDASSDQTPAILKDLGADSRVRTVGLRINRGQFGATKEGLLQAGGDWIAVLDGDLQDPPEKIPELVRALAPVSDPRTAVFAVKKKREEPAWFRLGNAAYRSALRLMGASLPPGAGSYCLISRSMAHKAAAVPLRVANLAAVLTALKVRPVTIPYEKGGRYDSRSRVGKLGLAREALVSVFILSPAGRYLLGTPELSGNL